MKKLFALVMVLAMALAIAVPALASGWEQIPATTTPTSEISISITALETEKNTSVLGGLYEQLAVMYPVVKGTDVHFYVEINIPAANKLSDANEDLLENKNLVYALETSNLELKSFTPYVGGVAGVEVIFAPETDTHAAIFDETDIGTKIGFEYWAEGITAGKDGVAAATIGFYNTWDPDTAAYPDEFGWDNDADGTDEFTVVHTDGLFTITANGTTTSSITFPVTESTGKINPAVEMKLTIGIATYYVNRAVNGDITFRTDATPSVVITPANAEYAAIKATFDAFFAALGFGYAEANYMTEAHFTKYFGTIAETTVKIIYPSGAVVVAPPTVEPPQTGDATTVVGFVMIALALVAAAAVTVKKVRA